MRLPDISVRNELYASLRRRIEIFVALPFASLDRLAMKARLDIAHVNELKGGAATAAHLLEFASVHGRWRAPIHAEDNRAICVGGHRIGFSEAASAEDVPWGDLGCDVVLECTGKFVKSARLQA